MRKRKSGQPAGTDLDWFVIPIERIRQWAIVIVLVLIAGGVGYFAVLPQGRRSPEEQGPGRDRRAPSRCSTGRRARPEPRARARTSRRRGTFSETRRESFSGSPLRRGVPPRGRVRVVLAARARRLGGRGAGRRLVHLRRGRRVAPARGPLDVRARAAARAALRRRLREGGRRPGRPRSCSTTARCTRSGPARSSSAAGPSRRRSSGSQIKMISGAVNVYTSGSTSTVTTDAATAAIETRLARVRRRRAGRQDRGDELPRPDDGVDRPRRPSSWRAGSRSRPASPDRHDLAEGRPARLAPAHCCRRTTGSTT